jgi:hypothetical protein
VEFHVPIATMMKACLMTEMFLGKTEYEREIIWKKKIGSLRCNVEQVNGNTFQVLLQEVNFCQSFA